MLLSLDPAVVLKLRVKALLEVKTMERPAEWFAELVRAVWDLEPVTGKFTQEQRTLTKQALYMYLYGTSL